MFEILEKKSKRQRCSKVQIDGQLSIFDIQIPKEINVVAPINLRSIEDNPFDIAENKGLTEKQKKVIERYKEISNRIVLMGGALRVEIKEDDGYKTLYFNSEGINEFEYYKKIDVHPFTSIIYSKSDIGVTEMQKEVASNIEGQALKRYGDSNIIFKSDNKIISVTDKGRVLEYHNVSLADIGEFKPLEFKEHISSKVKIGDLIETEYNKKTIVAKVTRIYNTGYTANIVWDNKSTPVAICGIRRIVKSV